MKNPEDFQLCTVWFGSPLGTDNLVGWVVIDRPAEKVASPHVFYNRPPAEDKLEELQEGAKMAANWPDWNDPDVISLMNSKEFHPRPQENVATMVDPVYRQHEAARVIARTRAGLEENS